MISYFKIDKESGSSEILICPENLRPFLKRSAEKQMIPEMTENHLVRRNTCIHPTKRRNNRIKREHRGYSILKLDVFTVAESMNVPIRQECDTV